MNSAKTHSFPEEERRGEAGNRKRGTYKEGGGEMVDTGDQECREEGRERPSKRRNRREGPEVKETGERSQETEGQASTPVAVKVRRVEEKLKESKGEKEKIQPTLRSFIGLRSGLMGPCKQPGGKVFPGSQVVEGRDLLPGSMRDTSKEIGAIGRKKESKGGKAAVLEKYGCSEEGLRPQENQLGTPGNKLRQGMRK